MVAFAVTALCVVNVQETGLGRVSPAGSATVLATATVYCTPAASRTLGVRLTEYEAGSYETEIVNAVPDALVNVKLAAVTVEGASAGYVPKSASFACVSKFATAAASSPVDGREGISDRRWRANDQPNAVTFSAESSNWTCGRRAKPRIVTS